MEHTYFPMPNQVQPGLDHAGLDWGIFFSSQEQWGTVVMVLNRRVMGSQLVCGQWTERGLLGRRQVWWLMDRSQWSGSGWWFWNCGKVVGWRPIKVKSELRWSVQGGVRKKSGLWFIRLEGSVHCQVTQVDNHVCGRMGVRGGGGRGDFELCFEHWEVHKQASGICRSPFQRSVN